MGPPFPRALAPLEQVAHLEAQRFDDALVGTASEALQERPPVVALLYCEARVEVPAPLPVIRARAACDMLLAVEPHVLQLVEHFLDWPHGATLLALAGLTIGT